MASHLSKNNYRIFRKRAATLMKFPDNSHAMCHKSKILTENGNSTKYVYEQLKDYLEYYYYENNKKKKSISKLK